MNYESEEYCIKEAIRHLSHALAYGTYLSILEMTQYFIEKEKLESYLRSWPNFSGDINYPVPSPDEDVTAEIYFRFCNDAKSLWGSHKYGDLRRELAFHIVEQLGKELNELQNKGE